MGVELLTEVYKLPKEHLLATVYEDDDEAFELWQSCTDIHPEHIVRCGKKIISGKWERLVHVDPVLKYIWI